MTAHVDFCGEVFPLPSHGCISIGREGTIAIDDNPYLHRQFLRLTQEAELIWLANVGSALTATVADEAGLVQTWLAPGARIPIVFARTAVWFTAGPTTYELEIINPDSLYLSVVEDHASEGDTTLGRVTFTPDQKLLILALAEDLLRNNQRGAGTIPHSRTAAERLGWTTTKFNRKIDNVCEKLAQLGVRGLRGSTNRTASNRRVRLVEYALAARLITMDDLKYLDAIDGSGSLDT